MHFFFSTSISRLMFLARYILATIALVLVLHPFLGLLQSKDSATASTLILTASGSVGLGLYFYLVRFGVMARLKSIGASGWYAFLMLLPVPMTVLATSTDALTDYTGMAGVGLIAFLLIYLLFILILIVLPEGAFDHSSSLQAMLYDFEVGEGQVIVRLVPLMVAVTVIGSAFYFWVYRGLDDAQSMDNAQLARQIVRGEGFTTKFLRPHAVAELRNHAAVRSLTTGGSGELFSSEQYPSGAPRVLPDTYNAPGYPLLLASWFYLLRPDFNQAVGSHLEGFVDDSKGGISPLYSGERWIPVLNFIFLALTGLLVYGLGRQLFDDRVAWVAVVAFFATKVIWQFALTALSTNFLMFLVTAVIFCALKIFCIGEKCLEDEEQSFAPAWGWGILLSLFLVATCLTRLHLAALLLPLVVLFVLMPRPGKLMAAMIALVLLVGLAPWFWHVYKVSGNPLGSNLSLLIYGSDGYKENQIFCTLSTPSYERSVRNVSAKEFSGFLWHLECGWQLLGSNLILLLFAASLIHAYKRRRAQMFQWFLLGTALVLIGANNVGVAEPETVGPWNILVLLLPGMLVIGSAYFFILLDRLDLHVRLINSVVVVAVLAITAIPLGLAATTSPNVIYCFPPYMPPLIKLGGQYAHPDEWVTTDMPWASAWYADRPSLWLPDSVADFESLNDNVCPTGILFLTPVTWAKPASNLLTGEDREWFPFFAPDKLPSAQNNDLPTSFPLHSHTATPPGGPEYSFWSDRPRWR